jgi:hypothetical protein
LPATNEFFSIDKKWLSSRCKKCRNEYFKKYRKEHPEKWQKFYDKNKDILIEKIIKRANKVSQVRNYSYKYLHTIIKKKKPKSLFCVICNKFINRLDLASINHTYTENPEDYLWVCRGCHILLDKQSRKRGVMIEY